MKKKILLGVVLFIFFSRNLFAWDDFFNKESREEKKEKETRELQKHFEWWPTDAQPAPVRDSDRGGYWWWPKEPGQARPWGNRGYVYVYKIIYDYKAEELPPPKPQELRPSLLVKKIIKNVKVYFDYNKADLRNDTLRILESAVGTLKRSPETDILITGNCDVRGSEAYNEKLGRRRAEAVKKLMLKNGIPEDRIRIISRGKLDAIAPVTDIIGMEKDRNAQFMIAEVEEVMIPYGGKPEVQAAKQIGEGKYLVEEEKRVEGALKASTKEYIVKKGDTLAKIAKKELGSSDRWRYLYKMNKGKIKDPNKLKVGQKIVIPIE